MRIQLLADVHSNLNALHAVLRDAEARGPVEALWCLGDLVNYGPDPGPCLKVLREQGALSIMGNHDAAAVGALPTEDFSLDAAAAMVWTQAQLTVDEAEFLSALPVTVEREDCTLVHGSLRGPLWEYLVTPQDAEQSFLLLNTPLCLIGHTHLPSVFLWSDGHCSGAYLRSEDSIEVTGKRLIYNPGGVGQPRDGDPRASYALFDTGRGTITHYRVEYNIAAVQERMAAAGLPDHLIGRLARGR